MAKKTARPAKERRAMLEKLIEIRVSEERIQELFLQNLVRGTTHLGIGQEACPVGVTSAMDKGDTLTCTYRGHGYALALGMDVRTLMAEMMGKATGCCGGKGGSMHMTDASIGLLGANAIVGGQIPIAVGAGLSAAVKKEKRVSYTIMGDGATNIGAFHESLNMASAWRLPVVFVIENNLYGEYSPVRRTTNIDDLAERAKAYGIPGEIVDGQDAEAVRAAAVKAADRARAGEGPTVLELKTYRYSGHSRTDKGPYRPEGELEQWLKRNPIDILSQRMVDDGQISQDDVDAIRSATEERVGQAIETAKNDEFPPLEAAVAHIYNDRDAAGRPAKEAR
jgi:pyruvate dehydrogenase E1 component alpha subunit